MDQDLLAFGLFVFGFMVWRWTSRRVWGTYFRSLLLASAMTVPAFATDLPGLWPGTGPEQYIGTYRVSVSSPYWNGYWDCKLVGGPATQYSLYCENAHSYVIIYYHAGAQKWLMDMVEYSGGPFPGGGGWLGGFVNFQSGSQRPENGPWQFGSGGDSYAGGIALYGGASLDFSENFPGAMVAPQVTLIQSLVGTNYAEGASLSIFFQVVSTDRVWRLSSPNGPPCFPVASVFSPSRPKAGRASGASPSSQRGQQGWDPVDADWIDGGITPTGFDLSGGTLWQGSSSPQPQNPIWSTVVINATSFGGYAIASFDVCAVSWDERSVRQGFWEPTNPPDQPIQYTEHFRSGTASRVAYAGGAYERWTMICATEPELRRPYIEIRKADGQVFRAYPLGLTVSAASVFAYGSDGKTLLYPYWGTDSLSRSGGYIQAFAANAGWTWPGLSLAYGTSSSFEAGAKAATSLQNLAGGDATHPDVFTAIRSATSRPSFVPATTGYAAAVSQAGAYAALSDMFNFFEFSEPITNNPTFNGHQFISNADMWGVVLSVPPKIQAFSPGGCRMVKYFTGISLIIGTGFYVFRRVAWGLGMRDAELVADVPLAFAPVGSNQLD
jgi:hypothetical protein